MINHYESAIHRIPPEILASVAPHLGDDESLITATHVCHHWRMAFLSSPRLWSHLDLTNEERALVFLERSKSTPVSVALMGASRLSKAVRELLNGITPRLTALGTDTAFLDGLLGQPVPMLRTLDISGNGEPKENPIRSLPYIWSLAITNPDRLRFHVPHLKNIRIEWTFNLPARSGNDLPDFFRSCPLLEVVSLSYDDSGEDLVFATEVAHTKAVSLPHLRSFTHDSMVSRICIGLFNRLSIPPTCAVAFVIDVTARGFHPWFPGFPAPRDRFYLTDVKRVNVMAYSAGDGHVSCLMLKTELMNSRNMTISFIRKSYQTTDPSPFAFGQFLDFLDDFGVTHSVESLHFEDYPIPHHPLRE